MGVALQTSSLMFMSIVPLGITPLLNLITRWTVPPSPILVVVVVWGPTFVPVMTPFAAASFFSKVFPFLDRVFVLL